LKTTTVAGAGLHDVAVDLKQLWAYSHRPLGHQPFYVFPRPDWPGSLTAAAKTGGLSVTELAFARSGPGWWFADWMVVLTTAQVAGVLHTALAAHGSSAKPRKARLVRFDTTSSSVTWGSGVTAPTVVRWRDFWADLEDCGRDDWPQLIRLPARLIQADGRYPRSRVIELLREVRAVPTDEWRDEQLVTLEPNMDGTYKVAPESDEDVGRPRDDSVVDDHRQVVFLEASALLPRV
jgi:hypothetical protein